MIIDYSFLLWNCVASSIVRHVPVAWLVPDVSFPTLPTSDTSITTGVTNL